MHRYHCKRVSSPRTEVKISQRFCSVLPASVLFYSAISIFATFIMYIITGNKSFRSATSCTDPGVLQELPGHVYFCMGVYGEYSSRLRHFGGFKLVTNLKETKEAKSNYI